MLIAACGSAATAVPAAPTQPAVFNTEGPAPTASDTPGPAPTATQRPPLVSSGETGGSVGDFAPEFAGISDWINSDPLTMSELNGRVVLVYFWTYTCINCIRTYPFLKLWNSRYADDGLVIVGVHTPEFEFEKDFDNVVEASENDGIVWPIAQDNDFRTWRSYSNRFWPAIIPDR